MAEPVLETIDLTKRFSGIVAVDDVTITFDRNQTHAIIGPNGAGKSTFLHLLSGAYEPTSGIIRFRGEEITGCDAHETANRGLVQSFQISSVFDNLTALENICVATQQTAGVSPYNFWRNKNEYKEIEEEAAEVLDSVELAHKRDTEAGELSYGQRRSLEIGMVVAMDPSVILFDEPVAGLSAENTERMVTLIEELTADKTVVLVEHNMEVVESLVDHVVVLHQGSVISEGSMADIKDDTYVKDVYLS